MGFTMSFDASLKIKKGDVKGMLKHVVRDIFDEQINHSNPNIDVTRTVNNQTYYYNHETNDYCECTSSEQIEKELAVRLSTVKKPLRKDAVVLRPLILQLDPKWYEEYEDEDGNSFAVMLDWVTKTFGEENIIGVSLHVDEGVGENEDIHNAHLHCLFTPVTSDGRLSQKDFFPNPVSLAKMHEDLRKHMNSNGYDIDMENKKPGKYAKRLSESEYRDYAKLQKACKHQDSCEIALNQREGRLEAFKTLLDERESNIKAKEEQVVRELYRASVEHQEASIKYKQAFDVLQSIQCLEKCNKSLRCDLLKLRKELGEKLNEKQTKKYDDLFESLSVLSMDDNYLKSKQWIENYSNEPSKDDSFER